MALQRQEVRRLVPGVVTACVFLVLVCLAAFVIQGANDRAALHRATVSLDHSIVALRTSIHARQLAEALAQERRQAIGDACVAQNHRNTATVRALDRLLRAAVKRYPRRAAQVRTSRASTILLINALAPKRDCRRVIQKATSS